MRYLVVDDDKVFRERLMKAFCDRGFDVVGAADGQEALACVKAATFERIVLDLRMPGVTGLSLVKEIKEASPASSIVVLTGYGSISTALSAIKAGAHNYLTKPTNVEKLLAAFADSPNEDQSTVPVASVATPTLAQVEWDYLNRVLGDCEGNVSQAAKALGLHRRSLQRKLAKSPGKGLV